MSPMIGRSCVARPRNAAVGRDGPVDEQLAPPRWRSGGTTQTASPGTRSASRLVASTRAPRIALEDRRGGVAPRHRRGAHSCRGPGGPRRPAQRSRTRGDRVDLGLPELERRRDRRRHRRRGHRPPRAPRPPRHRPPRRQARAVSIAKPCLAGATGTDDGDQPVPIQQAGDRRPAPPRGRRAWSAGRRSYARRRPRRLDRSRPMPRGARPSAGLGAGSPPRAPAAPDRVEPELLGQDVRPSWNTRSASACRPSRYSASISWPRSRSRVGCSVTERLEVADQTRWRPSACSAPPAPRPARCAPRAGERRGAGRTRRRRSQPAPGRATAPPPRERSTASPRSPRRASGGRGGQAIEPMDVDVVRFDGQDVPGRTHRYQVTRAEALAQLRHEPLQRVRHPRRRIVLPQPLDQPIRGHDAASVQGQHREGRAASHPAPPAESCSAPAASIVPGGAPPWSSRYRLSGRTAPGQRARRW